MKSASFLSALSVACVAWLWAPLAMGQQPDPNRDMHLLLMQALDQPTDLTVEDMPIRQAFESISEQTGVRIEVDPAVLRLLPYGTDTRLTATVKGVTLQRGLKELLAPIGMVAEVDGTRVVAKATPFLKRLGRRATWDELELLDKMSRMTWPEAAGSIPMQFQVPVSGNPQEDLEAKAKNAGTGTAAEIMEIATNALGWTWYPWDRQIVIVSQEQLAIRLLEKKESFFYQRQPLGMILGDIISRADLDVAFESGVLKKLPPDTRDTFSVEAEQRSFKQMLELICGNTGLQYRIAGRTVRIMAGPSLVGADPTGSTAAAASSDPYVGSISILDENGEFKIQFYLRESDLPPDVNDLRRKNIKKAVEIMRRELK